MKNKILFSIIFLVSVLFVINVVFAYQWRCYTEGTVYFGQICNYNTSCGICVTDEGWWTLSQNCRGLSCTYNCTGLPGLPCTYTNSTNTTTNITIDPEPQPEYCNCTEIMQRLDVLENDVTAIQSILNTLQNLVNTIQNTINSILTRLAALENEEPVLIGCAYNNPPCDGGYECIDNTCILIEEECTENWQCSAWGDCQPSNTQTRTCTDTNNCGTTSDKPTETQSCIYIIPDETVIFRTNVLNGDYGLSNGEIVFDYDKDGDLDCFEYFSFYNNYYNRKPTILGRTVEGYDIIKYASNQVIIKHGKNYIYQLSNNCETPLTKVPTTPYSTNGQELYK